MLVVKGCRSNKDVCGKLEFLLSNWDGSCAARRGGMGHLCLPTYSKEPSPCTDRFDEIPAEVQIDIV